jgi:hypothetical protein
MRRVGEVAKLMVDAGLIVLVSFISRFRDERAMVRAMVDEGEFCEVFVDTPLAVAEGWGSWRTPTDRAWARAGPATSPADRHARDERRRTSEVSLNLAARLPIRTA